MIDVFALKKPKNVTQALYLGQLDHILTGTLQSNRLSPINELALLKWAHPITNR